MNMSWLADLTQLEPLPPLVLAPALGGLGVLLLLFGWHIYRVLFVAMAVLIGGALGAGAGFLLNVPMLILALPLGIVMGLIALRIEKVGAFFTGGLCSALWVLSSPRFPDSGIGLYIAAFLAFVITGILAVFLWRPMIIVSLAGIGSWFFTNAILLATDALTSGALRRLFNTHSWWCLFFVALVTLAGVGFQAGFGDKEAEEAPEQAR